MLQPISVVVHEIITSTTNINPERPSLTRSLVAVARLVVPPFSLLDGHEYHRRSLDIPSLQVPRHPGGDQLVMALHHRRHRHFVTCPRAVGLQVQEASSSGCDMDHPHHWKICGFNEADHGGVYGAVEFGSVECHQRIQYVKSIP